MKLLIISHNCISNYNNMGIALKSIVNAFKKEELCQLYLYPTVPDEDICNSYYRITDKELLKSIINHKKIGQEIDKNSISFNNNLLENKRDLIVYRKKKTALKKYLRDFIWINSKFLNNNLIKWLETERPTHILAFPGRYTFTYNLIEQIQKYLNIPVITYITDNYYKLEQNSLLEKKYQKKFDKKYYDYMSKTNKIITICEEMTDLYKKEFSRDVETIMLGSKIEMKEIKKIKEITNLTYIGNMSYKRYEGLVDIGKALDIINMNNNSNIKLKIYSDISNDGVKEKLQNIKSIELKGFVKGERLKKAFDDADVLIHVESFDKECIKMTKYSVSTKISQILTSGKLCLAYGPDIVASIGFLKRTNSAYVVNDKKNIVKELDRLLKDAKIIVKIIENGKLAAKKNLDITNNSKKIYNIINKY